MRFLQNENKKTIAMAIFHLSVKPICRAAGRSATAAAAYRAGVEIVDTRTGEISDYRRKSGVQSSDIVLPDGAPAWASDRAALWNAAELAEKRKDACVAREFEVALPAELTSAERRELALSFAKEMAAREGCAVDVAIHAPGRGGDNRNHHAHILRTTRKVEPNGFGAKLDTEKAGRKRSDDLDQVRQRWAELCNSALERAGHGARVDHRSLAAQGIQREPSEHLGAAATGFERRTGTPSTKRIQHTQEAADRAAFTGGVIKEIDKKIQKVDLDIQRFERMMRKEFINEEIANQREEHRLSQGGRPKAELEAISELESIARWRQKVQSGQADPDDELEGFHKLSENHALDVLAKSVWRPQERPALPTPANPPESAPTALLAPLGAKDGDVPQLDTEISSAAAHAMATMNIQANMQALQKLPGMAAKPQEDLEKLAYWRGIVYEKNKQLPTVAQALERFDNMAADPALLRQLEAATDASPVHAAPTARVPKSDEIER